ncbi:hypothetical protein [Streptomyces nanshensis]|uniref:Uncharacterized protein n=1 Tax=Streptomyces nanshensis TaxID=518642 RepID=A0A1E7L6A7_9ACTN|nr:hypothetical protein [Streptomyces nanshensis]OEV11543.1 hypothetical protein AN218_12390 [Streptomyces nanshensis]
MAKQPRPARLRRATDLARAQQAVANLTMTTPDWDQTQQALRRRFSVHGMLVRAALRTVISGAELHEALHTKPVAHDGIWIPPEEREAYLLHFSRAATRLVHRLKIAALARHPRGPHGERRTRRHLYRQAHRITAALVSGTSVYYKAPELDKEAARESLRIPLGLVHHLVSGTPLPAECSTSQDW